MPASFAFRPRCLLPLAMLLIAIRTNAQPCADYADQIQWISALRMDAAVHAVAMSGHLAFVASTSYRGGTLDIVDIKDPRAPILVSRTDVGGYARRVTVAGSYALLAVESIGLVVVDVSSPANPVRIGTAAMRLGGYGLVATEKVAYVANYDGLQVIDLYDPAAPLVRGAVDTPGYAVGVGAAGDRFVYVADGFAGLRAIDVSDPASPRPAGVADTPGFAYRVAITEDLAYVADWAGGVAVVSIADPARPVLLKSVEIHGEAWSVVLSAAHDRAYVVGKYGAFTALDLSDPTSPVFAGSFGVGGEDVAVEGTIACVVEGWESLHLLDVTSIENVPLIGHTTIPGLVRDVALDGDLAHVAAYHEGLQIVDLSDPTAPKGIGNVSAGIAACVTAAGNHAYVGDVFGLRIVDVSDPTRPVVTGTAATSSGVRSVAVCGGLAYAGTRGLEIVDVTDPVSPQVIASLEMEDLAGGVAVDAGKGADCGQVYMTDIGNGFWVVDVSPPESLAVVAHLALPAWDSSGIALSEGFAYVAGYGSSGADFMVIDISDPRAPLLQSTLNLRGYGRDVEVSGHIAYVTTYDGNFLEVVDVGDPRAPRLIGIRTTAVSEAVAVDEGRVVVVGGRSGLFVFPQQCATSLPRGMAYGDKVSQTSPAERPVIRIGGPQPITSAAFPVEVHFALPAGPARLGIYSIAGRLVRSLVPTWASAGERVAFWNGADASGTQVASGVYFCRLDAPAGTATARLVVLR